MSLILLLYLFTYFFICLSLYCEIGVQFRLPVGLYTPWTPHTLEKASSAREEGSKERMGRLRKGWREKRGPVKSMHSGENSTGSEVLEDHCRRMVGGCSVERSALNVERWRDCTHRHQWGCEERGLNEVPSPILHVNTRGHEGARLEVLSTGDANGLWRMTPE